MNLTPINQPNVLGPAAIVKIEEDYEPGSRSGSWSVDDVRCNRTYTNRIKVITNNPVFGPAQLLLALSTYVKISQVYQFPVFADAPTENDTGSFLQSMRAELASEDGLQWLVTLDYGPFDVNHQLGSSYLNMGIIDPLERYPEVVCNDAKYERYKPYDETPADPTDPEAGGPLPFINTVGDPLLDPPKTEETRPTIRFIRNESIYNDDYASQFKDAVNSDEFLGYPPNTVKTSSIGNERIYDPDWGNYFRITYDFEMRDDDDGKGYTLEFQNIGYRQLVNGSGDPVNVVDADGNTVTEAVQLQQDGAYLPGGEVVYLQFQEFAAIAFEGLNIPQDILDANS